MFDDDFCSGDARRCAFHPHVKVSSDDGMFDGVCGECEGEMSEELDEALFDEEVSKGICPCPFPALPESPEVLYGDDDIPF